MPNDNAMIIRRDDWKIFRVNVDNVETITGYDFFSDVSDSIQSIIEPLVDNE
jgi:endonuclease G